MHYTINKKHRSGIICLTSHGLYLPGLKYQYSGKEVTLNSGREGDA